MRRLVVDAGNTRLKWGYTHGPRLIAVHAAAGGNYTAAALRRRLLRGSGRVESVWVASVAGAALRAPLTQAARAAGVPVHFLRTPRRGGGVTVAYDEPWRLGVDRFAAMVGAHALFPGIPLLIAGIGTALTLDLLDAAGRHRGGAIVPGPKLMVESLLQRTYGIRRRARGGSGARRGPFARSTRAAVEAGALYACAAAIDRWALESSPPLRRAPLVVLSGGGAPYLKALVRTPCVVVADLTLRGVAVLADAPRARLL